uniref:Uncharacterized protein n=1 Tax=Timema shepardi TaxID=629360 RepID=A0A7R9B7G7_TIMSH|nr:unnamed protein product [Timema shepardi]
MIKSTSWQEESYERTQLRVTMWDVFCLLHVVSLVRQVWAALGWAFSLRTIDSEGVKRALHVAVDTGKDVKECLDEQGRIIDHIPLAKSR